MPIAHVQVGGHERTTIITIALESSKQFFLSTEFNAS